MTWATLQDNIQSLDDISGNDQEVVANEIHDLLDHVPWEIEGTCTYKIINVYVYLCTLSLLLFACTNFSELSDESLKR